MQMKRKKLLAFVLALAVIISGVVLPAGSAMAADVAPAVTYGVHVQRLGDQDAVTSQGATIKTAGTEGQSLRLESIQMSVETEEDLHIQYRTHVQSIGWMAWVSDGELSGTRGYSKRLEAIQIQLSGADADKYDIYYRVHAQTYGWLAWAKNGEISGTAGLSKRLEAIQVVIVLKGAENPGEQSGQTQTCVGEATVPESSAKEPHIVYGGHAQTYGNQLPKSDGETLGITGESKRLEAFYIRVTNLASSGYTGGVAYSACVEGDGWQSEKVNGGTAGTMGQSKKIEAMTISLTGTLADDYDVRFRAHIQGTGWSAWAKGGQTVGTAGSGKRIEAIEVRLLSKAQSEAMEAALKNTKLSYTAYVEGSGWVDYVSNGETAGSTGAGKRMESMKVRVDGNSRLNVNYATHIQGDGWIDAVSNDTESGVPGSGKRIEALKITLSGADAYLFDVYYRAHIQKFGWLDWACNGDEAGSSGLGLRIEALEIKLVAKGSGAPGDTKKPFVNGSQFKNQTVAMDNKLYVYNSDGELARVVDGSKPMVALTYDDGPATGTDTILNVLKENGAGATFFVVGSRCNTYASTLKKAYDMGCEIGSHTYNHKILTSASNAEIIKEMNDTDEVIESIIGVKPGIMRPPGGGYNSTVASLMDRPMVNWSVDTLDWKTRDSGNTTSVVLSSVRDGDIVLMHDLHACTAVSSKTIIPALVARGYQLVTVSEMAYFRGGMEDGVMYTNFR